MYSFSGIGSVKRILSFVILIFFLIRLPYLCFLFQILAAVLPVLVLRKSKIVYTTQMKQFDFETKTWQPLPSMERLKLTDRLSFLCAEYAGNHLYVAAKTPYYPGDIYRYHIVNNVWDTLPRFESSKGYDQEINCLCSVSEHVYAISDPNLRQRYSLTQNKWQSGSVIPFLKNKSGGQDKLSNVAAVVMKSKIYVLHGYQRVEEGAWKVKSAVFHCFDPQKNEWEQKASTSYPHFGSSLLVDNSKLYVAWGRVSSYYGDPEPVEVYSEENDNWAVVDQTHIPPNNLGAVEVEGKIYFIINKFPFDSGIRIPPGEVYHISLHEWESKRISGIGNAVLCYMPVKKESLENKATNEKKASVKEEAKKWTEFR